MATNKKKTWLKLAGNPDLYKQIGEDRRKEFWEMGVKEGYFEVGRLGDSGRKELYNYVDQDFISAIGMQRMTKQTQAFKEKQVEAKVKDDSTDKLVAEEKKRRLALERAKNAPTAPDPNKPKLTAQQALAPVAKAFETVAKSKPVETKPILNKQGKPESAEVDRLAKMRPITSRQGKAEQRSLAQQAEATADRKNFVKETKEIKQIKADAKVELAKIDDTFKKLQQRKITLTPQEVMDLEERKVNLKTIVNPTGLAILKRGSLGLYDVALSGAEKKSADKEYFEEVTKTQEQAQKDPIYKATALATDLAVQGGIYGLVGKAAQGVKLGQMLMGGANASIGRQILGSQIANLGADVLIQTPIEVMNSIANDESLDQFAKDWATNMTVGAIFNGVLEGAVTLVKARQALSTTQAQNALKSANIEPETAIRALDSGDKQAIQEIRDALSKKPTGLEQSPTVNSDLMGARTPDIYVNPQGGASPSLPKAEMPLDVPTNQMALPAPSQLEAQAEAKSVREYFTGSSNPNIKTFTPGGDGKTKTSGDSFGEGIYLSSNPDVAKQYAQGSQGRVYKITADNPILDLDQVANKDFVDNVYDALENSSKDYRNRIIREMPFKEKSFSNPKEASAYYDLMDKSWKQNDGFYEGNMPEADKVGDLFIVRYKDFGEDLKKGLSKMTNKEIFDSIAAINTNSASDMVMKSGFDGIEFHDKGAFQGGIEGKTAVIYKNTDKFKIDEPSKPVIEQPFDFSAKVKKEIPRNVTPAELTEERLLDLQERVRSGQIPQDEAESVAKQLIDEMEAPKPQETITQQGKIEPKSDVIPQGDTMARVDTLPTKSTDLPTEELAQSFRGNVAREVKKSKQSFSETISNARKQFEDDLIGLQDLEKQVKGKVSSAEDSLYKTARLYKGAPEKANLILKNDLAPIVDDAIAKGFTKEDLGDYALAVHARDVNNSGINSGFTNAEIDSVISKFENTPLEQSRQQLVKLSNDLLDDLVDSGRISKEQVDAMRSKWENYMPLFRNFDDDKVEFAQGLSSTFSNVSSPIKSLKGSDREVLDPLESMVKNIYKITDTSARNRVGVQLDNLAKIADESVIRKLESGEEVGRKNVVNVYVDGKKVSYEVEPEVFKAFNNLDKESSSMLINFLSKPASMLRAGATLTPEFSVRNPIRDIQNAFQVSNSGFNIADFGVGLAQAIGKGDLYQQWIKEGGGYGNIISMDRQKHKEALTNALKKPVSSKFVNVVNPKSWVATMRAVSDVTESATKIGEFRAALRSGQTPQEAAFRARDIMDFARAGSSVRQLNKVVAFLNANIQGKSKIIRAIKENPTKAMTRIATTTILPTVGITVFNDQFANDEQRKTIDQAPEWMRSTFWLVAIPGSDIVARIPKGFETAVLSTATEKLMEFAKKSDPEVWDGFLKRAIADQLPPTSLTGLLPIFEAQTNYSFFRDAPVIPRNEQNLQRKDQKDNRTSHLAKAMASGVGGVFGEETNWASPRVMDYAIRSSTGGLGSYALDATDKLVDFATWVTGGEVEGGESPSKTIEQLPVLKAFLVNPMSSAKQINKVYDLQSALTKEKNSLKLSDKELAPIKARMLDIATDATKELSGLTKESKRVESSTKLTADEKRSKLLAIAKNRNEIGVNAKNQLSRLLKKSEGK